MKPHITFVDYERFHLLPALTDLLPVSGSVCDRLDILLWITVSETNASPRVKRNATDVHGSHTG